MALVLPPTKVVLLAVHFATNGDADNLRWLATHHRTILKPELLLRILLTYLPETLPSSRYVPLLQQIKASFNGDDLPAHDTIGVATIDCSPVESLSNQKAANKIKKLKLLSLNREGAPADPADDLLTCFLIQRAYRIDEGARLLSQLPDLFSPFLEHSATLRAWTISILLPFLRRSSEYYIENLPLTLEQFAKLPDVEAVDLLLAQTASTLEEIPNIGRDLRGLIGPWLYNESRWPARAGQDNSELQHLCPGFERVLEWLLAQASSSWQSAVSVIEQWDGPGDVDLGDYGVMWLKDEEQEYLERRYARAAIASAYLVTEPSVDALKGVHRILVKIMDMLDRDPIANLQMAASMLAPLPNLCLSDIITSKHTKYLRNDLLENSNVLTSPSQLSLELLHAGILSAFLLVRAGVSCSVRMVVELALLRNEQEQRDFFQKLMHGISERGIKAEESYWKKARNEILWLRDWGAEEAMGSEEASKHGKGGIFSLLTKEFVDSELLKTLLAHSQYSLARLLYEDGPDVPLPANMIQDIVVTSAMTAYDNASNPNRTRGGVKKCDDILYTFPRTMDGSLLATRRIESLLKATHALSKYRLVLKQGEPFTPVVLRVHSDPICIIKKVLEQNPKSYTNIQDMLEIGFNMVKAGLTCNDGKQYQHIVLDSALTLKQESEQLSIVNKRVTAFCIDSALAEHDFETAYSYVMSKLTQIAEAVHHAPSRPEAQAPEAGSLPTKPMDEWSWKAALNAGKYKRTSQSTLPTHLGTSSGNPEIRHLEQRIECLSTALRIAPPHTLQEILNTFRRCEEELEVAIKAEEAEEEAWNVAGDMRSAGQKRGDHMPGGFLPGPKAQSRGGHVSASKAAEEAPLSLFSLARAVAPSAQKNLSALSSLQRFGNTREQKGHPVGVVGSSPSSGGSFGLGGILSSGFGVGGDSHAEINQGELGEDGKPRARKRDQLRDAAMGTLVSGVGWLVGAQPVDRSYTSDRSDRE